MNISDLSGLSLWGAHKASEMVMLQFGARQTFVDRKGRTRIVGQYALHIQCPFALLVDGAKVDSVTEVLDRLGELRVTIARSQSDGLVSIYFEGNVTLNIRPDVASPGEQWRLFEPALDSVHLVFSDGVYL